MLGYLFKEVKFSLRHLTLRGDIMKNIFLAFVIGLILVYATARADAAVQFNYTTSFDGKNALLYKTFNSFFGLSGSNAISGNQELYETYAVNPGKLSADGAKIFSLCIDSNYSEKSTFTIFGGSESDVLYTSKPMPSGGNINQFYLSDAIFDGAGYTGDLNFKISNSNGTFFSDIDTFANINLLNGKDGKNGDAGIDHFLFLDVSELVRETYGDFLDFDYTNAYLVGYEDRAYIRSGIFNSNWDGDYNDGIFLVFTNSPTATPEPASVLIVGLGLVSLPLVRRLRRKR